MLDYESGKRFGMVLMYMALKGINDVCIKSLAKEMVNEDIDDNHAVEWLDNKFKKPAYHIGKLTVDVSLAVIHDSTVPSYEIKSSNRWCDLMGYTAIKVEDDDIPIRMVWVFPTVGDSIVVPYRVLRGLKNGDKLWLNDIAYCIIEHVSPCGTDFQTALSSVMC